MITRRRTVQSLGACASLLYANRLISQRTNDAPEDFYQLDYPTISSLDHPQPFGYQPATEGQKRRAQEIIDGTPHGPRPIDIAESFVNRFYTLSPNDISQWPAPASWNPLIVSFFSSTSLRAENDMVAWCAAFANWCIERSGKNGSRSASSQSFLSRDFKKTDSPAHGDLVVFSCYDKKSGKNLGLGHVTFFQELTGSGTIKVIGGNQSGDGHSSIIRDSLFSTEDRTVHRHVNGEYIPCTMRLNSFIRMT